jgi:drug/metabolite transporter (DMT)-like permease
VFLTRSPDNQFWPVLSLLYTATFWGVVWYPLRLLEDAGLAGLWQTLISYGAILIVAGTFVRGYDGIKQDLISFLVLMLAAGWANLAFILAMLEGTVVRALLLFYLSPIWTLLFSHFILKEGIEKRMYVLMAIGMAGMLLMLWDPQLKNPWPTGRADWFALSSGFAFALSNVIIRKMQQQPILLKTASTWLGCVLVAGAGILLRQEPLPEASAISLSGTVLLGVAGFMLATLALQYGVTHMRAQRSAVILLFELVAGAISATLLANEVLQIREIIGGLVIIIASYFVATAAYPENNQSVERRKSVST